MSRLTRSSFTAAGISAVLLPLVRCATDASPKRKSRVVNDRGNVLLERRIARVAAASTGTLGMWARKLDAPEPVELDADEVFPAASVIKIVILLALFQQAEKHPGIFRHRIKLELSDFVGGSEVLDSYNPGQTIDVETLVRAMIDQSDNSASNVLLRYLGLDVIQAASASAGLRNTQLKRAFQPEDAIVAHNENRTTPRDMGRLLYQIERGAHEGVPTVASALSCRKMIDIMLRQEDRNTIARGLPHGTPLANKTGAIDGVRNDVGIVDPYGENPYVLAVLTKELDDFTVGDAAIARIASIVNTAFN